MNRLAKIVISRTLERPEWAGIRLVNAPEELAALKQQAGGDMLILGSSDLTTSLVRLGLVDEVQIFVSPVVLGAGKSVFRTATERMTLTLLRTRVFNSGNVRLYYQPARR